MKIHFHQGDLPSSVNFQGSVAIDTETMGLNFHRDRLCLVQLSEGDNVCHLVKIQGTEAPHLKNLLTDPKVLKIFHFARFDVTALFMHFGVLTAPLYCTKIASKLVRTFTDRHGLKELCQDLLSVEISKQEQMSDWGAAELTEKQLNYAATDVLHLHRLKQKLNIMLEREGRMELAQACFNFIPHRIQLDLLGFHTPDIFQH